MGKADGWPEKRMLEAAWQLIANSGAMDNPENASPGWKEAALNWRDAYHEILDKEKASGNRPEPKAPTV